MGNIEFPSGNIDLNSGWSKTPPQELLEVRITKELLLHKPISREFICFLPMFFHPWLEST